MALAQGLVCAASRNAGKAAWCEKDAAG